MHIDNGQPNKPLYLYRMPMFSVTVSTVLIVENGVIMIRNDYDDKESDYRFPGGIVRAARESIHFCALRHVKLITKVITGVSLKKELLIPVDFRSEPERSEAGNEIDIGFALVTEGITPESFGGREAVKWFEVDFENQRLVDESVEFYMDHKILLKRALDIALIVKD